MLMAVLFYTMPFGESKFLDFTLNPGVFNDGNKRKKELHTKYG